MGIASGPINPGEAVVAARWAVALGMAFIAAWSDARTRRIPNMMTLPMLMLGYVAGAVLGGWSGLWDAVAGSLVLGVPYFLLFAFGGGGAGDAKMMGALGAWVGLPHGLVLLAAVAICGGVLAIGFAMWKRRLGGALGNLRTAAYGVGLMAIQGDRLKRAREFLPARSAMVKMPYGLAIFAGTLSAAGWVLLCH